MNETRRSLGFGLVALVPIGCCIGVALIAAAGISVGLAAWAGGIALAALVLSAVVVLFAARLRRHRNDRRPTSIPGIRS
jgi:hypothetical protein